MQSCSSLCPCLCGRDPSAGTRSGMSHELYPAWPVSVFWGFGYGRWLDTERESSEMRKACAGTIPVLLAADSGC